MTRRDILTALGSAAAGKIISDAVVVGPQDSVILTLQPGYEGAELDVKSLNEALSKSGINPDRVCLLRGLDCKVVKSS